MNYDGKIRTDERGYYPTFFEKWVSEEFKSDSWNFPTARLIDMLAKAYNYGVQNES